MLSELHHCYFTQRVLLLTPSITTTIADLATKHSRDHCALVMAALTGSHAVQCRPWGFVCLRFVERLSAVVLPHFGCAENPALA